jgi:hypothetical protein
MTDAANKGQGYRTKNDADYRTGMAEHLERLNGVSRLEMVNNFAKYAGRQEITRFLTRYELFRLVQDVQGCILECGVFAGQGLMSWAQLSAILEPVGGAHRRVYGFDTFEGFTGVHDKDLHNREGIQWAKGDLKSESYDDLIQCVQLFDKNRFLPQFPKVELVKGDFLQTAGAFLKENQHLIVSLMYLDFDIFEPTKVALKTFLPRMPKGAVIAFDEVNVPAWPGETLALLEELDMRNVALKKFPWSTTVSYCVL